MTAAQRTSADRMIAKNGQLVSILGGTPGTYDPATGTVSNGSYNKSCKAVLFPASPFRKVDGGDIKAGDEQMLLSGLDQSGAALPVPPVNSIITLADASKRTLIAVDVLRPAGLPIIYDCIVRGNA
jgi:hypothetical protein